MTVSARPGVRRAQRGGNPVLSRQLGTELKRNRFGATLSVLASGALILSGCGADKNAEGNSTSATLSVTVNCGGRATLKASGSTAQANAMTASWAMAFFWLRLAHAAVYLLGIPYVRTLIFTLGYVAVVGLFWELIK